MKLASGLPSVRGPVPALQLVAEHQHKSQGVVFYGKGRVALFFPVCYGELVQTVVHGYGRKRIQHGFIDLLISLIHGKQLSGQDHGAEYRMIHKVIEAVRTLWLFTQNFFQKIHGIFPLFKILAGRVFGHLSADLFHPAVILSTQSLDDSPCKDITDIIELSLRIDLFHGCPYSVAAKSRILLQPGEGNEGKSPSFYFLDSLLVFLSVLKVSLNLFERQLKGISDIVEQRSQSPVPEEMVGQLLILSVFMLHSAAVHVLISPAVLLVGLVNGQPQSKDIDGVGVVVSVFHQKRTGIGFKLRKQLDHPSGSAVGSHKHLQIAEIYIERSLSRAGIDKPVQSIGKAQPVDIHLHVVGDHVLSDTPSQISGSLLLFLCLLGKPQILTPIM